MTDTLQQIYQIEPLSFEQDSANQASIGGIKIKDLVAKYGSPLYILCEQTIRERINAYKQAFAKYYPNSLVVYASKALNCKAICKLMQQENLGLDVVSQGELHTALTAGLDGERGFFHGNNKSVDELKQSIDSGVTIMLDNYHELNLIKEINSKTQKTIKLMIRVTPGIECHTHEYIKTGSIDSKFGFNLDEIKSLIKKIQSEFSYIQIQGLHAHIGSQIFETEPHQDTCTVLLKLYKEIKEELGLEFQDLNIGGGLGIQYLESDDPPSIDLIINKIAARVKDNCKNLELKEPRVLVEPGRSLIGPAGVTVYTVGNIKNIPQLRKYIAVDGGMADNVRPIMYQAEYQAAVDGKANKDTELVTIAGKYCESGDILIKDIELPKIEAGDLLMVFATGAYNYSMASNYNRATRPAMVLVKDGQAFEIIKKESLDDLIKNDLVPEHLS